MNIIEQIKTIDIELFLYLNGMHNPFGDEIMYWMSNKYFWIPFYIFLLVIIITKYQWKHSLVILLITVVLITVTDQLSLHLFKNLFMRYRPCHNIVIQPLVHLIGNCGGKYGFISSHASNTFALAILLGGVLQSKFWKYFLLIWAMTVSYSRIYLGVHYPLDVIGGMGIGICFGYLFVKIHRFVESLKKINTNNNT